MNTKDLSNFVDDEDDFEEILNAGKRRPRKTGRHPKQISKSDYAFLKEQDDSRKTFKFTYKAARFEEWWLLETLGAFYEHKWISDVLKKVKVGKEASVYLCKPSLDVDAPLLAAKIYRPSSLRSLKNVQEYRLGRLDLDEDGHKLWKEADVKAAMKRTAYGEEVRHTSWIAYEYKTMEDLFNAGADVPKVYAKEKNAILMRFIGDLTTAAPILNSVSLTVSESKILFERVIHNIDLMLQHNCIHGDLSAYNILYWNGEIKLIDFPQIVIPESNPSAWKIFQRDVIRICQYFSTQGVACNPQKLSADLWTTHGHKIFNSVEPKYLDADKPEDRYAWEKQK
jgi:RIO kinase 1